MPQRAIINEKHNVEAYATDDAAWAGLTAAYSAKKLRLPCCGNLAIPKENSHGTRYFSHGPFKRLECDWKEISGRHERLVGRIAAEITTLDWSVTTETKLHGLNVDILCTHHFHKVSFAIMIELKLRNGIKEDEAKLRCKGIPCLWMLSPRVSESLDELERVIQLPSQISIDATMRDVKDILLNVERAFEIEHKALHSLVKSTWIVRPIRLRGIPDHIVLNDPQHGCVTKAEIRPDLNQLQFNEHSFQQMSVTNKQRCMSQFENRLRLGIELWWPGFPDLNDETFDQLAQHINTAKVPQQKAESERPISNSFTLRRASNARTGEHVPRDVENFDWGEMRLRHIRRVALTTMDEQQVERWINIRSDKLGGHSPAELAAKDSDALRKCEVLLGLRDPKTNRPLNLQK